MCTRTASKGTLGAGTSQWLRGEGPQNCSSPDQGTCSVKDSWWQVKARSSRCSGLALVYWLAGLNPYYGNELRNEKIVFIHTSSGLVLFYLMEEYMFSVFEDRVGQMLNHCSVFLNINRFCLMWCWVHLGVWWMYALIDVNSIYLPIIW